MNISRLILRKLRTGHLGVDRAIKRKDLLSYLHEQGAKVEDREMRAVIEEIPVICSGPTGYFIAKSEAEVELAIQYLHKKAMPLLKKIRRKKEAHPQFYHEGPDEPVQEELF